MNKDLGEATPAVAPVVPFVAGAAVGSLINKSMQPSAYSYTYATNIPPFIYYPPYPPVNVPPFPPYPPYPYYPYY